MELIATELDNQTYEFEPDVVAQMLSPKLPRKVVEPATYPTLQDFECLIDEPTVQKAIQRFTKLNYTVWKTTNEKDNFIPLSAFLTKCVKECDQVYDSIFKELPQDSHFKVAPQTKHWLPQLCFIKYDKCTGDGIQQSTPLKPDIVGLEGNVNAQEAGDKIRCWWNLLSAENENKQKKHASIQNYQIMFPMELKENWLEIVKQAGTYARSQFATSPLRSFALVIGANHVKEELRFLIFHHGGLSASKALKLDNAGCNALRKILLSILLWQSAKDAGLPTFTNGQTFYLPEPIQAISTGNIWNIKHVFCHSLSTRGRGTYVVGLESMENGAEQTTSVKNTNLHLMTRVGFQSSRMTCPATKTQPDKFKFTKTSEKSPLSPTSDSRKRSADEATLDISHCEKRPRPLAAVKPLHIVPTPSPMPSMSPLSTVVVKCSWKSARREKVEPEMLAACKSSFGTPQVLGSFVPCFRENQPMCNSIFLPPKDGDHNTYHWPLFKSKKPKEADFRTLGITVLVDEGRCLDECSDALDLCNCLLQSLIGWLSLYQHGYLHRDVSIGNLLKLVKPVSQRQFNALEFTRLVASPEEKEELEKSDLNDEIMSRFIKKHHECEELFKLAQELNAMLDQVGLGTECKSIIIDGDMAAYMPTYFDSVHNTGIFSGTPEFMSLPLLEAMDDGSSYLHSPLDDLWSFFWTALWATLWNCHDRGQTEQEKKWRRKLCGGQESREVIATSIHRRSGVEDGCSLIFQQMTPLLRRWFVYLNDLQFSWPKDPAQASNPGIPMLFHKFAYTGVLGVSRMISEHVQSLKKDEMKE